ACNRAERSAVRDDRSRHCVEREQKDDVRSEEERVKAVIDGVGCVGPESEEGGQSCQIEGVRMDVDEENGGENGPGKRSAYSQESARESFEEGRLLDEESRHRDPVAALDSKMAIDLGRDGHGKRHANGERKCGNADNFFGDSPQSQEGATARSITGEEVVELFSS